MQESWTKPAERFCGNCGQHLYSYVNENGHVKFVCKRCGMVTIAKKVSRRKASIDEHAPPRQELKF